MTHSTFSARVAPLVALLLAGALAGCATPQASPVEVTRFARPQFASAQRGPVTVAPAPGIDGAGIVFGSYAAAVGSELTRLGFGVGGDAGLIAEVSIAREVAGGGGRRSPVSVGLGGSTGGYGSGVGLGVGINLSGRPKPTVATTLAVTLRDRASGQSLWEGRARTTAPQGSPLADTPAGAERLARALFQGFPGRSGETVLVR